MSDPLKELAESKFEVDYDTGYYGRIRINGDLAICIYREDNFNRYDPAVLTRAIEQLPEMLRMIDYYNGTEFKQVAAAIRDPQKSESREERLEMALKKIAKIDSSFYPVRDAIAIAQKALEAE